MTNSTPGVSGMSVYVPRFRVQLARWCEWTGAPAPKVEAVVGRSFRVCGPHESIYTMTANAVLRLIENNDVDPARVGFLGLGTESSTDNAAGAVIVKGMVDAALAKKGRPTLARNCEVPEFKHACLGGIYALKAALRWLALEGRGRQAIVVCGDIAEYERGSSGEQTQGAGAVAFLLESEPKLFEVDLSQAGSASSYRGIDFRKPMRRHFVEGYAAQTRRLHDFPVFNGKYSTACYVDAVVHALDDLFAKTDIGRSAYIENVAGVLMHRPYHMMPIQAFAAALVWGLGRETAGHDRLRSLATEAGVDAASVLSEIESGRDLFALADQEGPDVEPFPGVMALARHVRKTPWFTGLVASKMGWGDELVRDLGNLYTASLPAWIGAAYEDARNRDVDLAGRDFLTIGYGSGDAAEALPIRTVVGWEQAASRLGWSEALQGAIDLSQEQYEGLHDGREVQLNYAPQAEFVVSRVGERMTPEHQDLGIEFYDYVA